MNLRKENEEKILRVAIVLDESGSMGAVKKETLSGLNEHIQELRKGKEKGITTYVTLVTFSGADSIKERYVNVLVDDMPDLTKKDYDPNGMTAMFDGLARGLNLLKGAPDTEKTTYMVLVITDGQENASKEFKGPQVKEMITTLEANKKWTITYMGANQDIFEVQDTLGINPSNMALYSSSSIGTKHAFRKMSDCTSQYLCARADTDNMSGFSFYNNNGTGPADFSNVTVGDPDPSLVAYTISSSNSDVK